MSKLILNEKNNKLIKNIDQQPIILNIRKPISKVMSLDNFLKKGKASNSLKNNSNSSIYSFQKSYISPTVSFIKNKKPKKSPNKISPLNKQNLIFLKLDKNNPKKIPNISSMKQNNNYLNHSIKSNLYNNSKGKKKANFKKIKIPEKIAKKVYSFNIRNKKNKISNDIKKNININNNYKNKIIINKEKLIKNLDNNLIFNSLIDIDKSCSFGSHSNEEKEKLKSENNINNNYIKKCNINLDYNKDDLNLALSSNESKRGDNLNSINNNVFDVGSISNISKNWSGSAKERIIDEEIKNNNKGFEKIINELIEEENCKSLFKPKKESNNDNEIIQELIQNHEIRKDQEIKNEIKEKKDNHEENSDNLNDKSNKENESLNNSQKSEEKKFNQKEKEKNEEKSKNKNNFLDKKNQKIIKKFIGNIINDSESHIKNDIKKFIEKIINETEKENKIIAKDFIKNLINECIVNDFIGNIFEEYENEVKGIVKNFIKEIFEENESEIKDTVKDFIEDIFVENENEVKGTVRDFIGNIFDEYKKEEKDINIIKDSKDEELNEDNKLNVNKNENNKLII